MISFNEYIKTRNKNILSISGLDSVIANSDVSVYVVKCLITPKYIITPNMKCATNDNFIADFGVIDIYIREPSDDFNFEIGIILTGYEAFIGAKVFTHLPSAYNLYQLYNCAPKINSYRDEQKHNTYNDVQIFLVTDEHSNKIKQLLFSYITTTCLSDNQAVIDMMSRYHRLLNEGDLYLCLYKDMYIKEYPVDSILLRKIDIDNLKETSYMFSKVNSLDDINIHNDVNIVSNIKQDYSVIHLLGDDLKNII